MSEDGYCTCDGDSEVAASCGLRRHREPALARRNPSPDLSGGAGSPEPVTDAVSTEAADQMLRAETAEREVERQRRILARLWAMSESWQRSFGGHVLACAEAVQTVIRDTP